MFGDKLREFRISKELKQSELAEKLGVTNNVVSSNETGKVSSYVSYTERLNALFGCSLPLVSKCKVCKTELTNGESVCPVCAEKAKNSSRRKKRRGLLAAAKEADSSGTSYGKYFAGAKVTDVRREARLPEFLELGKTIKI